MFSSMIKKLAVFLMAATTAVAFVGEASAEDMVRTTNVSDHQLALKGYDAVSYFDAGAPTAGKSRFTYTHKGVEYRFTTASNRDTFAANPRKYEPQYGGFCAFGASVGLKLEVDPEAFEIVDGKLYLNNSLDIHAMWLENPKGRIKAANSNWKRIKEVSADKLEALPFDG